MDKMCIYIRGGNARLSSLHLPSSWREDLASALRRYKSSSTWHDGAIQPTRTHTLSVTWHDVASPPARPIRPTGPQYNVTLCGSGRLGPRRRWGLRGSRRPCSFLNFYKGKRDGYERGLKNT